MAGSDYKKIVQIEIEKFQNLLVFYCTMRIYLGKKNILYYLYFFIYYF